MGLADHVLETVVGTNVAIAVYVPHIAALCAADDGGLILTPVSEFEETPRGMTFIARFICVCEFL